MPEVAQSCSESSPLPTVTARLPAAFHALAGGRKQITAEGNNIREVLVSLDRVVPGALDRIIDQAGPVKGYVNIYRNDSDIRDLDGLETKVANNDVIWIIPAVAGGRENT
jgi:sulfur-carrier protein